MNKKASLSPLFNAPSQMKVLLFYWVIKVPEPGGKTGELQKPSYLKSSVKGEQISAGMTSSSVGPL